MSTMTLDQMFAPSRTTRPRSTVRLTRRGRVVVVLLALMAVLAVGIVVASGSVATDDAGTPEPTTVVLVEPGDTLWGIASAASDDGDVASMMDRIEKLNGLDHSTLLSGQRLLVPID
jgi:Tfp pilus assembly protein FimV